jgi:hypothetical protein
MLGDETITNFLPSGVFGIYLPDAGTISKTM